MTERRRATTQLDPHPSPARLRELYRQRTGHELPSIPSPPFALPNCRCTNLYVEPTPQSEHEHQVALFAWAEGATDRWPELALMFAIANGGKRGSGEAGKLKAEGVKRGVPDLCLPVPRSVWHGLYVELKRVGGKPDERQLEWRAQLRAQGYRSEIVEGWQAARDLIVRYLES